MSRRKQAIQTPCKPLDRSLAVSWDRRYRSGKVPWDTGVPDVHLQRVVGDIPIRPGAAIDIGCGTGTNAIWLVHRGFEVTGIDISAVAIQRARKRAASVGIPCSFELGDFFSASLPEASFDFAFDLGCFHLFEAASERMMFGETVFRLLKPGAKWLSIVGSLDGAPRRNGPPRRSARDIVDALECFFKIIRLEADCFDPNDPQPCAAWVCLMQKRGSRVTQGRHGDLNTGD